MRIERTPEFIKWFDKQTDKAKAIIDTRLRHIQLRGYFGDHKFLGDKLLELRWKNGRRVYYALVYQDELVLLLLGGLKSGQKKDIAKAKKILSKYLP